jgi:2-polyprenyl-6-methoxyphenol hydroxylase-like FAD-dependent oxidoreductase
MRQKTALISGAGIAGPAAAYWLNRAGWKTTIIEHAPRLREGGYVIDFWGLGYDLAERMGLSGQIEEAGYHVRELRVVGERGQRVAGFGTGVFNELTGRRFVTLARSDLSRMLVGAATPQTELLFGDEIIAIRGQGEDGAHVGLRSGAERHFDLIVGADGLRSGVRRLAFGPDAQFEKPLGYAVAAFEVRGYRPRDPDVYLIYGQPGRMLGRFTLHEDRTLFLFVFAFDGAVPETPGEQKALVSGLYRDGGWEVGQILEQLDQTDELYLDRVSQIIAPVWSKGRVALVGDAAFCVSLLAGQGSALAIIAAYVLAGELARAEGRIEVGLANYEARLRRYIETKQAGAVSFAGAFAPRTRFGLWFRNLVTQSLGIPGFARLVIGREIMDRLPLPDYALDGAEAGLR